MNNLRLSILVSSPAVLKVGFSLPHSYQRRKLHIILLSPHSVRRDDTEMTKA